MLCGKVKINVSANMTNQQIIAYIKLREQLLQSKRAKANALSSIINGLIRFSTFGLLSD